MSGSMSRSSDRLRSPGEGPRQARPTTPGDHHAEVPAPQALPRRPGAAPSRAPDGPVGPRDVEAHMAFLKHVSELLEENGEYVEAPALTPARTWVRYGGLDAAPVTTDGPLSETSDLVAGWYVIDVESPERAVRAPVPPVLAGLVRRGGGPHGPRGAAPRHRREEATYAQPRPAATEEGDDTLFLLFCCCHPDVAPASQVALTLRAVGGLTTWEIADAFYVPEATMAQRISRAKRALQGRRLDQPGDLAVVLRVLYLVYTAGHAGRVDLTGEAIRLTRQLTIA